MNYKFDINREDLYEVGKPKGKTRERLTRMAELGMEEVNEAQFGIPGVMSGLYIEIVWGFSDEDFNDYLKWVENLIKNPNTQRKN
jgi:hypothetical protein